MMKTTLMIASKLRRKGRTTFPLAVRIALDLKAGDDLAYWIENSSVTLTKLSPGARDDALPTFSEWNSAADVLAYADL